MGRSRGRSRGTGSTSFVSVTASSAYFLTSPRMPCTSPVKCDACAVPSHASHTSEQLSAVIVVWFTMGECAAP
jgi:hypothetical protein